MNTVKYYASHHLYKLKELHQMMEQHGIYQAILEDALDGKINAGAIGKVQQDLLELHKVRLKLGEVIEMLEK